MKKPISSGFTKAMDTLAARFDAKYDRQNPQHKTLAEPLKALSNQLHALETIKQNRDPLGSHNAHILEVGKAANRLRYLAEENGKFITNEAKKAEASFEAALKEHGRLQPGPFAPEIRLRIYGLKPADRVRTIQDLIEGRDGVSLSAILEAPRVLTGLSADDIGKFREQYFQAACPDLIKARDTYRDLASHAQAVIATSLKAASEHGAPDRLRELEAMDAASAKAKEALNGQD